MGEKAPGVHCALGMKQCTLGQVIEFLIGVEFSRYLNLKAVTTYSYMWSMAMFSTLTKKYEFYNLN